MFCALKSSNSIKNTVKEEVLKWRTTFLGLRRGSEVVLEEVVRKASENSPLKAELNAVGLVHRDRYNSKTTARSNWPHGQIKPCL